MAKTIWDVLKAPVITEKALRLKEDSTREIRDSKNKKTIRRDRQVLAFRVATSASKHAIKDAVESIFKVKVDQVRIVNYRGKTVRRGRTRNGAVYMPPFEGILNQEAVWSIKAYLETRREKAF